MITGSSFTNPRDSNTEGSSSHLYRTNLYLLILLLLLVYFDYAAEGDLTEKPIEPIKVYSEKELIREFEKISSTLVPEKDWSIRITAMQRFEGLVLGGLYKLSAGLE